MNITIEGKDFDLTPAIKTYVEEKLGKLSKFSSRIQRIGVQLDIEKANRNGLTNRIEVWVYLPEKTLQAGLKAEHMNEAIDLVYEKIERQVVSYERKRRDLARGTRI
jgi:putative sigma-54 modulation protein